MPILAGWLTGEQVSQEIIAQTLTTMGTVLNRYGGEPARTVQPGMGLITFADNAYTLRLNDEPPVLDWIPERRTLVYRRPRTGTHPLYYIENWPAQGNLLFASEIKALLAVGVARHLHLAAIDALLRYGFIPAPWTAFKDIYVVPAGANLRWQHTKMHVNPAPDYHLTPHSSDTHPKLAGTEFQTQFNTTIQQVINNQLPPHEQLLTLTNGQPASTLVTFLTAQSAPSSPFPIAAFGYKKYLRSAQWHEAALVADHCLHPFLAVTAADQPEFWLATIAGLEAPCVDSRPLAIHQLLHTATTETGARVALSALGSSALLGTHRRASNTSQPLTTDTLQTYLQPTITPDSQQLSPLWSPESAHTLSQTTAWTDTLYARKLARQTSQYTTLQQSSYYLDLRLHLPDRLVTPFLQLAQQERVAVRSPFLHKNILDLLTQLPDIQQDDTTRGQLLHSYLQNLLPDFTRTATQLPLLAPTSSLFQINHTDLLQQTLSPEAIATTGIFAPAVVKQLLERGYKKGAEPRELLLVFTTQLLCQLFGITNC